MNTSLGLRRHMKQANSAFLSYTGSVEQEKASVLSGSSSNVRFLDRLGRIASLLNIGSTELR
jgi:hypothetical protein